MLSTANKKCPVCGAKNTQMYSSELYCFKCGGFVESEYTGNTEIFPMVTGIQSHIYKCCHEQTKVKVGDYIVWCSGTNAKTRKKPDLAVFLDIGWIHRVTQVMSTGTSSGLSLGTANHPMVYVDWPDMNVINLDLYSKLVDYIVSEMQHGKQVEIGCVGGHGRTGTLLAGLLVKVEHLTGDEAIKKVKVNYCGKAIETGSQKKLICDYANKVNK